MSNRWYAEENGNRIGPLSFEELKGLASRLRPNDLVWNEGASTWVTVASVPGLRSETTPAARDASEESVWDLVVPVGQRKSSHEHDGQDQAPKPGHPKQTGSHTKWRWVGAVVGALILGIIRVSTQQNNAKLAPRPAQQAAPVPAQLPPPNPALVKPVENQPLLDLKKMGWVDKPQPFDQKKPFPAPVIQNPLPPAVKRDGFYPTDVVAAWHTGKEFHTLVLTNTGAELRDVSIQIILHEADGFKFSIPTVWETWRKGEEKQLLVRAHNYPRHEIQGTAIRGFATVQVNVYWAWDWQAGIPFIRK